MEVCEEFGINPYELISSGSMLITTPDGPEVVRQLQKSGINAAIVGKVMKGNDRVLLSGDEKRFLEPPKSDELYKIERN